MKRKNLTYHEKNLSRTKKQDKDLLKAAISKPKRPKEQV